jgi:hypothetical protein
VPHRPSRESESEQGREIRSPPRKDACGGCEMSNMTITTDQTDAVRAIFDDNFDDEAFMTPELIFSQWVLADGGNNGSVYVPMDCWESFDENGNPTNVEDVFTESSVLHAGKYAVETIEGYGARMSASGYLDCTEWMVGTDPVELAQDLADIYGDNS